MIPRIFHQVFITGDRLQSLPSKWLSLSRSLAHTNPQWEYRYWDNNALYELVHAHYPHLAEYFTPEIPAVVQSDIGRCLILQHYGGWYLDFDYEVLRPLDTWNDNALLLPQRTQDHTSTSSISNAILASEPQHWFWTLTLQHLQPAHFFHHHYTPDDILTHTGPAFISRIYADLPKDRKEDIAHPARIHFHHHVPVEFSNKEYKRLKKNKDIYGLHYTHSSWRDDDLHKNIARRRYYANPFLRPLMKLWKKHKHRR